MMDLVTFHVFWPRPTAARRRVTMRGTPPTWWRVAERRQSQDDDFDGCRGGVAWVPMIRLGWTCPPHTTTCPWCRHHPNEALCTTVRRVAQSPTRTIPPTSSTFQSLAWTYRGWEAVGDVWRNRRGTWQAARGPHPLDRFNNMTQDSVMWDSWLF